MVKDGFKGKFKCGFRGLFRDWNSYMISKSTSGMISHGNDMLYDYQFKPLVAVPFLGLITHSVLQWVEMQFE